MLEVGQNSRLLVLPVGWNEHGNGLADGLRLRVAEETFRTLVPTGDDAVKVFADDGVIGGIDNSSQRGGGGIVLPPFGHVFNAQENHWRAVLQLQRPGI